ncbi:uncharacterized protein LOC105175466 [Sesamum indicum]|uniref:Uncharacterized protein LOC105175466 n=1 Tax=Sesamum indicum TaxID=4182 RepID=A0A6I9UDJ4_SESIN|nr:uncharacterized protein LOC105175466 [Sesamum indicum]
MITIIPKPSTFNSSEINPLYISNPRSSISPFFSSQIRLKFPNRRRRFQIQASSLVLPLLPFPIDQVLVPSEAKTLHLYEARYIALLEESLFRKNKLFVHFVLDPIGSSGTSSETSFAARYGCLVIIEKVEQLEIGALISIRGVGRVKLLEFKQVQPYLTGEVTPLQDNVLHSTTAISSKVLGLKEALHSLNSLEIKLKAPGEASLQTQTINSLFWAENQQSLDCNTDFIPPVAERVSFAALQPVSGATKSELLKLQREKLTAMDVTDTLVRLEKAVELVRDNTAILAAKLAIQSLDMR